MGEPWTARILKHSQWVDRVIWDLVIVDEYHYGAWNEHHSRSFCPARWEAEKLNSRTHGARTREEDASEGSR